MTYERPAWVTVPVALIFWIVVFVAFGYVVSQLLADVSAALSLLERVMR